MAQNKFVFEGLAELKQALRDLPGQFNTEASKLALGAATGAAHDIRRGYPRTAESLAQAVTVTADHPSTFAAGATIKVRHPLAWIFESGTEDRRYLTSSGKQHRTGRIKEGHFIVPVIMRARVRYYQQLREMLRRAGLIVSG